MKVIKRLLHVEIMWIHRNNLTENITKKLYKDQNIQQDIRVAHRPLNNLFINYELYLYNFNCTCNSEYKN